MFFILLFATAFYFSARRSFERNRWFLRLALYCLPLPWIAAELGWIVAEYGRQPWAVDGMLPTFLGVSTRSAANVWLSLVGFARLLHLACRRGRVSHDAHDSPGPGRIGLLARSAVADPELSPLRRIEARSPIC